MNSQDKLVNNIFSSPESPKNISRKRRHSLSNSISPSITQRRKKRKLNNDKIDNNDSDSDSDCDSDIENNKKKVKKRIKFDEEGNKLKSDGTIGMQSV